MHKKIAIGMGALLLMSSMSMLSENASAQEFTLNSWEVADDDGYPSLLIKFDVTDSAEMQLTDPDGVKVDYEYVDVFEHGVYMHLAGYHDTPKVGTYEFVVTAGWPEYQIFSKRFTFNGPDLSITDVHPNWKYYENLEYYALNDLNITVKNNGDLPIYPDEAEIKIDGERDDMYLSHPTIMPNEEKSITDSAYIIGISPGEYTLTVTIKDNEDVNIAAYTEPVLLEEKKGGGNDTPGFEFAFLIIAIASIILFKRRIKNQ